MKPGPTPHYVPYNQTTEFAPIQRQLVPVMLGHHSSTFCRSFYTFLLFLQKTEKAPEWAVFISC